MQGNRLKAAEPIDYWSEYHRQRWPPIARTINMISGVTKIHGLMFEVSDLFETAATVGQGVVRLNPWIGWAHG